MQHHNTSATARSWYDSGHASLCVLVLSSLIVVTKRISLYSQFMPLSPCFFYHHLTNAALEAV